MTGVTFLYVSHPSSDAGKTKPRSGVPRPAAELGSAASSCARYTQASLKTTLQAAGCKPRVAHKASKGVFIALNIRLMEGGLDLETGNKVNGCDLDKAVKPLGSFANPLARHEWIGLIMTHVAQHTDSGLQQEDLEAASSILEGRRCVAVLLAGTSGCGKSTLAGLLASRLGITTLLSTDSIRHMMRSFVPQSQAPLLWASTYQAGDHLTATPSQREPSTSPAAESHERRHVEDTAQMDARPAAVEGYKAQSRMVLDSLDAIIGACASRGESLVIEGVLLSTDNILALMSRHHNIIPFLIHISNEAKHRERFAVRAKYMTLEAQSNRYVHYLPAIRAIQHHLEQGAASLRIPAVNNTNVDRSVAIIHSTVLACLRRQAQGAQMLDASTSTVEVVAQEFAIVMAHSWSSKRMLQLIRRKAEAKQRHAAEEVKDQQVEDEQDSEQEEEAEEREAPEDDVTNTDAHSAFGNQSRIASSDAGSVSNGARTSHDGGEVSTAAATRMDGSVMENELDMDDQAGSQHHDHGLSHLHDPIERSRDSPHRYQRDDSEASQLHVHW
ncbi:hypothetical protein WJX73_005551 [Symbiochloris irregularis]|uniref:2-phosphoglycerate kinase n=1 Tax=Symbiochloris irregularis TaxID=706552 RepID=A0AAW1NRF0_9CHLO